MTVHIPNPHFAFRISRSAFCSALIALATLACASSRPTSPVLPEVRDAARRDAVVFVPGITGTDLRDRESGRVAWGDLQSLFLPRDDGYAIALPIGGTPDRLETGEPILDIGRRPFVRRDVYGPIVDAFEANGWRRGRDLILFGYDWRRDSVENARLLTRAVDRLPPQTRVHLVCQSNATYLCRWAARWGDVSLDDAEQGIRRPAARVETVTLLATANGGGIRILREIDRGRRYVKFAGRRFRPEVFFTYASLYQDLPAARSDLFVDETGNALNIDLFDAATWKRYGWSIFGGDATRRAARAPGIFADEATRLDFLRHALDRAKRMHALLRDDSAPLPSGTRLYSIQNRSHPTITRAVVTRRHGAWRTLFAADQELADAPRVSTLLTEPGDVHATVPSQQTLAPSEASALVETLYADGDHLTLAHSAETLQALVEIASNRRR